MTRGRRGEAGMVTAEIAVALPALVLVLTLSLGGVAVAIDHLRCVDAARAGARLLARGEDPGWVRREVARQAPDGADIGFVVSSGSVTVEISGEVPPLLRAVGVSARPRGVAHAIPERTR